MECFKLVSCKQKIESKDNTTGKIFWNFRLVNDRGRLLDYVYPGMIQFGHLHHSTKGLVNVQNHSVWKPSSALVFIIFSLNYMTKLVIFCV